MPSSPDLVFVYGTLRPSLATGKPLELVRSLEHVGPATVRGVLYDLGEYPGMVAGEGLVHGDLLRVSEPSGFDVLDDYEESRGAHPLYRRVVTRATVRDGSEVATWVYLYARSVTAAFRIVSGDYASR